MNATQRARASDPLAAAAERYADAIFSVSAISGERLDFKKHLATIMRSMSQASPEERRAVAGILGLLEPRPFSGSAPSQRSLDSEGFEEMRDRARLSGRGRLTPHVFRQLENERIWFQSFNALEELALLLRERGPEARPLQALLSILGSTVRRFAAPAGPPNPDFMINIPTGRDLSFAQNAIILMGAVIRNPNFMPVALSDAFVAGLRDLSQHDAEHLRRYVLPALGDPGFDFSPATLSRLEERLRSLSARPRRP